jgi:acyl-CoA dehydrogenase
MNDALDRHLSDEQRTLYAEALSVGQGLAAVAAEGRGGEVNRGLLAGLADSGLLGRMFGTGGISAIDLCLIREALARRCTEAETAFALQGLGAHPIVQAGSPAVRERWIGAVAAGRAVAAFALTEPDAGSDPAALALRAEPVVAGASAGGGAGAGGSGGASGWRLSGEKLWISNAPDADVYTVFARTDPSAVGARGLTAFAVPGDAPGLTGERRELLAPHAIGSLHFDGVLVEPEDVLGEPGGGFRVAMHTLDRFRPSVGAFAIGMARTALELTVAYTSRRQTFGRPLREHQALAHRIAELSARVEAARLLVHQAALAFDEGRGHPAVAAMAKLQATEVAQEAVDAAVQFHGAVALEVGHPLEHLYRDVRAPRIYEGASEIQREIIARSLFREFDGAAGTEAGAGAGAGAGTEAGAGAGA